MWDRWGRPRGPVISEPGSPLAARTRQDTRSQRKQRTYLGRAACFSGGASLDGPGHRTDAAARPPTPAHGRPLPTGRAGADEAMETMRSERRRIGTRNGYRCRRPSAPVKRAGAEPHASPRAASRGHVPVGAAFPRPVPPPAPHKPTRLWTPRARSSVADWKPLVPDAGRSKPLRRRGEGERPTSGFRPRLHHLGSSAGPVFRRGCTDPVWG